MNKIGALCLAAWLVWAHAPGAQTISVPPARRAMLASLVEKEPEARNLFRKLKQKADACLNDPGQPVVQIQTAGRLNSDPAKVQTRASLEDMKKLHALGYSFAVTSASVYAAAARRIILSWAEINEPTGMPIDETKLEPLFVAYDLTRGAFTETERATVERWLRKIAEQEVAKVKRESATAINNWNSHRLKIVGLLGFLLEDKKLIACAVEGFRRQVEVNLNPDGSSYDFHERDALHYHCYDLEPLLTLAIASRQNGIDLYPYQAPGGASLGKSVDFLVPYCRGEKSHCEWVHSKVEFDRARADAGEDKFTPGVAFAPRQARRVLELAAFFDDAYGELVRRLFENAATKLPTWQTVLNQVLR